MNTRAACLSSGTLDLCTSAHLCQQFDFCILDMAERAVPMKTEVEGIEYFGTRKAPAGLLIC